MLYFQYLRNELIAPLSASSLERGQHLRVRRTLSTLAIQVGSIVGIGVNYTAMCAWLSFGASSIEGDTARLRLQALLSLYVPLPPPQKMPDI